MSLNLSAFLFSYNGCYYYSMIQFVQSLNCPMIITRPLDLLCHIYIFYVPLWLFLHLIWVFFSCSSKDIWQHKKRLKSPLSCHTIYTGFLSKIVLSSVNWQFYILVCFTFYIKFYSFTLTIRLSLFPFLLL
jgi:hypothetical protein